MIVTDFGIVMDCSDEPVQKRDNECIGILGNNEILNTIY